MKFTWKYTDTDKITTITATVDEDNKVELTKQEEAMIKQWEEDESNKFLKQKIFKEFKKQGNVFENNRKHK